MLKKATEIQGPVMVGIPVDYRNNHRLAGSLNSGVLN